MKSLTLLCVLLAGCATGPSGEDKLRAISREKVVGLARSSEITPKVADSSLVAVAMDSVRSGMKDPAAAQFRRVRIVNTPNGRVVCGEVNGKNSYGGYVGFKPFIAGRMFSDVEVGPTRYPWIDAAQNTGMMETCGP